MIKKFAALLLLALAAAVPGFSSSHVDGEWFQTECYGCPDDPVAGEVTEQQDQYNVAAHDAESIMDGEKQGDLRAARQKCVDLATWSYVKAEYTAAMGGAALAEGDTVNAAADYTACLEFCKLAQAVELPETVLGASRDVKVKTSHDVGERFAEIAKRQLAKIHKRK